MDYRNSWLFMPCSDYVALTGLSVRASMAAKAEIRANDLVNGIRARVENSYVVPTQTYPASSQFTHLPSIWPGHRPCQQLMVADSRLTRAFGKPQPCAGFMIFVHGGLTDTEGIDLTFVFDWFVPKIVFIVSYLWHGKIFPYFGDLGANLWFDQSNTTFEFRRCIRNDRDTPFNKIYRMITSCVPWREGLWE